MKNVKSWLKICLIIALSFSCAALGAGRKCIHDPIPLRPLSESCVFNSSGIAFCFDKRHEPQSYSKSAENMVGTNAQDNEAQEEWIKILLKELGQ